MDYRSMYDANYVGSWDLPKDGVVVQIESVSGETLTAQGNKKSRKPVVKFVGKAKKFALNKTNGKTIAAMYGSDTTKWAGKLIAIYPTQTNFGRDTVDCIRVRPGIPKGKADTAPMPAVDTRPIEEPMREPGEDP